MFHIAMIPDNDNMNSSENIPMINLTALPEYRSTGVYRFIASVTQPAKKNPDRNRIAKTKKYTRPNKQITVRKTGRFGLGRGCGASIIQMVRW